MLLLHLIDLPLLLVHDLWQLQFVGELGAKVALGVGLGRSHVRLRDQLRISLRVVEIVTTGMVAMVWTHLVSYAQLLLVRHLLLLCVHFYRGWTWALRLIHDLDLAFANLNRVRVTVLSLCSPDLLITWDSREPLARAVGILLHVVSLRHAHCIALR